MTTLEFAEKAVTYIPDYFTIEGDELEKANSLIDSLARDDGFDPEDWDWNNELITAMESVALNRGLIGLDDTSYRYVLLK